MHLTDKESVFNEKVTGNPVAIKGVNSNSIPHGAYPGQIDLNESVDIPGSGNAVMEWGTVFRWIAIIAGLLCWYLFLVWLATIVWSKHYESRSSISSSAAAPAQKTGEVRQAPQNSISSSAPPTSGRVAIPKEKKQTQSSASSDSSRNFAGNKKQTGTVVLRTAAPSTIIPAETERYRETMTGRGTYSEESAQTTPEQNMQSPEKSAVEMMYLRARELSGVFNNTKNGSDAKAAMEEWYSVKYQFRRAPGNPWYIEADTEIRRISAMIHTKRK